MEQPEEFTRAGMVRVKFHGGKDDFGFEFVRGAFELGGKRYFIGVDQNHR